MNSMLNPCQRVEIDGCEYSINTDFSVWIQVESLLFASDVDVGQRLGRILALVYPKLPPDPIGALDKILWFWSGGETTEPDRADGEVCKRAYDSKADFPYIWAAFLGQFGIDLSRTPIHWWHFRTLLGCLDEECRFSKIVAYRTADLSTVKDPQLRSFYAKMKKRYRLPDSRDESTKAQDTAMAMEEAF